ncbi:outer dynein arm docking complex protein, putative (macronuclear) [Tetrahymena thermophila SB210]|uniref:Outer dynein arm docking complex protein, putative n=1 Tax=Tetrahymena thermophila (strain SB210) TaxID=312017 RepID=Q23QP0_TETTS|nr:outer dynein arm docking complex protein, putative [Tetrahymena thermophila SB210]EAR98848.2 outer dynein arm docking complex protein, putative [Tetrahymena thermophila SB210]|eukprot:XP_001019093.2 outer dynein arm docking complex protein, putative [Tetrahymena thermophila SB210]
MKPINVNSTSQNFMLNPIVPQTAKSAQEHKSQKSRDGHMQRSMYGSQMIGSKIAKLQDTGNFYAKKIEQETVRLEHIEKEIEKTEKILQDKRKDIMNKKKSTSDSDPYVLQKKIKSMHMKLDYLKKKYNESLANNDSLKDEINHLRREKNIFDNIYIELKQELHEKKEQLKKVLQESQNAKEEIEKGKQRLEKYKIEADIEKKKFEKEFESVYQTASDTENRDERLKEKFILGSNKQQQSQYQDNSRSPSPFDRSAYDFDNYKMISAGATGMSTTKKKDKNKRNQEKENMHLENLKQEVAQYEDIFKRLMEETGTQDMSKIVKTFVDYENENYSLFKYINTLRDDTETLMQQKKQLQQQIDMYKNKPQQYRQEPKTIKFMELKKELETIEQQKEKYKKKHETVQSQLDTLKKNIPVMFENIGCLDKEYLKEIPKNNDGTLQEIDDSNMLLYLAAIERRTNDLLQLYNEIYKQKSSQVETKSKIAAEESNISSSHFIQKNIKFDDLDTVLIPLGDEFKNNYDKIKEEKRNKEYQIVNEIIKEKNFMELKDFQENAKNEFKKIQSKQKIIKKK